MSRPCKADSARKQVQPTVRVGLSPGGEERESPARRGCEIEPGASPEGTTQVPNEWRLQSRVREKSYFGNVFRRNSQLTYAYYHIRVD